MRPAQSIRRYIAGAAAAFAAGAVAAAGSPAAVSRGAAIGSRPANIAYSDLAGKRHFLLGGDSLPAVYLFLGANCPIARAYTPRILKLEKEMRRRQLRFVAVYSNISESRAEVARDASVRGYRFQVVKDDGMLAARLGASTTPEAVVLDRNGIVRYRGRIDDSRDASRVRSRDLRDAIAAVLAGKPVRRASAPAFGCAIMATRPAGAGRLAAITYTRNVAPILRKNCVTCHRPGEVAPFALENYQQAAIWARQIKDYTGRRAMPPWKADSHGEFLDERRLTDSEVRTLARWCDDGAPEGDPKQLAPAPKFPSGWQLGTPDYVISMPQPYDVEAEGRDEYRCFVIPTTFDADRYVSALEFHPGNRGVVHHVIAYLDLSGKARKLDELDPGPGYHNPSPGSGPGFFPTGFFGGWAPGNEPRHLPAGIGNLLPRGADIVLEVHYHKSGKPETDRTRMGIYFSKAPVAKRIRIMPVVNPFFQISAGEANYTVPASARIAQDITVLAVTPHMHMIGRSMKVKAVLPDKTEMPLVSVPDWDFNWQLTYAYRKPLRLPKGTNVSLLARYDNSSSNPRNPNSPPKRVGWGEQTTDEMCIAFLTYVANDEDLLHNKPVHDMFDFLQVSR